MVIGHTAWRLLRLILQEVRVLIHAILSMVLTWISQKLLPS